LVPRNYRNHRAHVLRLPLSYSLLEPFSQATPRTTRPPPNAEETYAVRIFRPRHYPPATRQLVLAKTTFSKDAPSNEQHPPPHARLPAHVPREATILTVHRDTLQPVGKWYGYLQSLLVAREHPRGHPRRQNNTEC
jgi:hypothetical protein